MQKTMQNQIPKNWQEVKLKDVVTFKTGKLDSNAAVENGKYPFFTCSQQTFRTNTYSFNTKCVLLAGNNANGIFPLKYFQGKFDAYQRTYIIETINKNSLSIKYLFYSLKLALNELRKSSSGAVTKFLTKNILDNIDVFLPRIETQQKVAAILSAFDDLIENNRRRIEILEKMAQLLYREWFVEFRFPCLPENYKFSGASKPGLPDGAGKAGEMNAVCTYEAVGGLPLPQPRKWFIYVLLCSNESFYIGITNDLYYRWYQHKTGGGARWTKAYEPIKVIHYEEFNSRKEAAKREKWLKTGFGRKWLKREYVKLKKSDSPAQECKLMQAGKMVDSELGKIPEGWEVKNLGQIAKNYDSKRRPVSKMERENMQGDVPYYGAAKIIDYVNDYIFDGKYLLMAEDGSVITKSGNPVLQFVNEKFWANNHTHILQGFEVSTEYLYLSLAQFSIQGYITGVAQPKINQDNLDRIPVLVPKKGVAQNFDGLVKPIFENIWNLETIIGNLQKFRDLLLPKLMSGEIRV